MIQETATEKETPTKKPMTEIVPPQLANPSTPIPSAHLDNPSTPDSSPDLDSSTNPNINDNTLPENRVSFVSASSGGSFTQYEDVDEEGVNLICYTICYDELTPMKINEVKSNLNMLDEIDGFEDRLNLSCINYKHSNNQLRRTSLDAEEYKMIRIWENGVSDKKLDLFLPQTNRNEALLANVLLTSHINILNESELVENDITALSPEERKSQEENHKVKYVVPLLTHMFDITDNIMINWDVNSKVYAQSNSFIIKNRPDAIFITKQGSEIGCVEIKPFNTDDDDIENDRIRIAEVLKKQLHLRIAISKGTINHQTFGLMIYGSTVEFYCMNLDASDNYNFTLLKTATLPTLQDTYTYMAGTLEIFKSFKKMILDSLSYDINVPYNTEYIQRLKPTVTLMSIRKLEKVYNINVPTND